MQTFIQKFAEKITGTLECFDRVIFKGHLMKLSFAEGMETFLAQQGLRIKDFGRFVRIQSDQLVLHAKMTASKAQRPYRYLPGKIRKDDEARRIGKNGIKMYDKFGLILRIETVINNPYGFLVRRHGNRKGQRVIGWFPMTKGVTGLHRFAQVARSANHQYLTALSVANDPAPAQQLLRLCTRRLQHQQRSYRGFNPAADEDIRRFKALLQGQHHLHGFQNADVRAVLYPDAPTDPTSQRRLAGRVRRYLKRLHVRGLLARIPHSRRWRVTVKGHSFMAMAIKHHDEIYINTLTAEAA
jgi:hypothetical protein